MNFLIVLGLAFAALYGAECRSIQQFPQDLPDLPKVIQETMQQTFQCAMQLGPDAMNLPQLGAGGSQALPEDNEVLNQVFGCLWEKKGIINKNGDVNAENLKKYLSDILAILPKGINVQPSDLVEACKDISGINYGQKAVKINNCVTSRSVQQFM